MAELYNRHGDKGDSILYIAFRLYGSNPLYLQETSRLYEQSHLSIVEAMKVMGIDLPPFLHDITWKSGGIQSIYPIDIRL